MSHWLVDQRVIDNIPRGIDAEFIIPAASELRKALIDDLAIFSQHGPKRCRNLLAEAPAKTRQREDLVARRGRLERAKLSIRKFGAH